MWLSLFLVVESVSLHFLIPIFPLTPNLTIKLWFVGSHITWDLHSTACSNARVDKGVRLLVPFEPRCEKTGFRFPTWSHTNRAVQPQKVDRGLKFGI